MRITRIIIPLLIIASINLLYSCTNPGQRIPSNFDYNEFKDSIQRSGYDTSGDFDNVLDSSIFIPGIDSLDTLLVQMDSLWRNDIELARQIDTLFSIWKKEDQVTPEELEVLNENIEVLDSFFSKRIETDPSPCREKNCLVYAEVIKSTQTMLLYLGGELMDSFKVSTGLGKYRTPNMNVRASGPIFKKYTSKKWPEGNYRGLGNMPYAVFFRGGYAIHGTTTGNQKKLGKPASHGCIRLHPMNGKIFYELVKRLGIKNTWVMVKNFLIIPCQL